ncbi:winged helix-turn-helix transcriptional regulator, partial [Streptomyces sp. SID3343]|uniref:Lrp/AsnC family transcriptional regulator n=1 Tax=Streptomyces sp. SID3343 TaxID=2690260 RepID=UPI00137113FF
MTADRSWGSPVDDVDAALIRRLTRSPRESYTDLAEATGISLAAARLRVRKLIADGVLVVGGRVDPRRVGTGAFGYLFVAVEGPSAPVAARIGALPEVAFVAGLVGGLDLALEVRASSTADLMTVTATLRALPGVGDVRSSVVHEYVKQDWSGLGDREPRPWVRPTAGNGEVGEPDETDRRVVAELVADGRVTYSSLAREVGLSQPAARARVQRLLDSGLVTIAAHLDPGAAGVDTFGAVALTVTRPAGKVADVLATMPETVSVATTLGAYDVFVEYWSFGERHTGELLERMRAVAGVRRLRSFGYLWVGKEDAGGGPRLADAVGAGAQATRARRDGG